MRFVSRILIGVAAAATVAIIAPAAAGATTAGPSASSSSTSSYDADWGPYHSSDHKAEAEGHVTVHKKGYKHWYWKTEVVKKWTCFKNHHGKKVCKWVVKKQKKRVWEWRFDHHFTVHSTLANDKWWGKRKCAWETFKVVGHDGSAYYKSFRNCWKHPKEFSFHGKNAAHIYVDVSRGGPHHPGGHHSGWESVYHAAP